ncbi:MAG: hypothetical protein DHS20C18_08420 [Saprospiraceae bacterium]|nr:MAG: hypothetical protein DHS20C18_08420 [Saprospiraceae bacterium]
MDAVEAYITELAQPQRGIMHHLHELITSYPEVTAKIRYKIPFYYCRSWICYLNPVKDRGVELAFTRGNELSNEQGLLNARGRKQVSGVIFHQLKEIPDVVVHEVLLEALLLDEEVPYRVGRKG